MPNSLTTTKLSIVQSITQSLMNWHSSWIDSVYALLNVKNVNTFDRVKRLEMFQSIKTGLEVLRFSANPSAHPFDRVHFYQTVRSILAVIFQCVYLFYGTKSLREFINAIYMTAASIALFLSFLNTIYNSEQMYRFLDKFEHFINARKFLHPSENLRLLS